MDQGEHSGPRKGRKRAKKEGEITTAKEAIAMLKSIETEMRERSVGTQAQRENWRSAIKEVRGYLAGRDLVPGEGRRPRYPGGLTVAQHLQRVAQVNLEEVARKFPGLEPSDLFWDRLTYCKNEEVGAHLGKARTKAELRRAMKAVFGSGRVEGQPPAGSLSYGAYSLLRECFYNRFVKLDADVRTLKKVADDVLPALLAAFGDAIKHADEYRPGPAGGLHEQARWFAYSIMLAFERTRGLPRPYRKSGNWHRLESATLVRDVLAEMMIVEPHYAPTSVAAAIVYAKRNQHRASRGNLPVKSTWVSQTTDEQKGDS